MERDLDEMLSLKTFRLRPFDNVSDPLFPILMHHLHHDGDHGIDAGFRVGGRPKGISRTDRSACDYRAAAWRTDGSDPPTGIMGQVIGGVMLGPSALGLICPKL
ncbi:hypothetical protein [Rhizobium sp. Root708]|uniref:hypothetical protein n=1 Tax=Rhizobium sp. Root708 TaxID=1736592 RepID=UPI0012E3770A|nr:hypothetical protein [Rhizobium sp. Root708]